MSDRAQHIGDGAINTEEHLSTGGVNRKAVGLFAKDAYGEGTFELSAISTASGAVLSVTPSTGDSVGFQTVFVGTPTLFAVVNTGAVGNTNALATLLAGPNQIGSVTISNQLDIRSVLSFPTINVVTQDITVNSGMLTLFPGPNQIGSVTISHVVSVAQSGTWDEVGINDSGNSITVDASNLDIRDLTNTDVVTAELSATDNAVLDSIETAVEAIQAGQLPDSHNVTVDNASLAVTGAFFPALVSLASGTEVRSLATVLNWPTTLTSLASGTEVRSLTTILPRTDYIGLVSVSGNVVASGSVGVTGLISLASGTEVRALATILNFPGLISLASGTEVRSLTTILPRTDYIGLVSVSGNVVASGTVGISGLISLASGTEIRSLTTILPRTDYIGLMSISGNVDVRSVLSTATLFAVVNTGAVGNTNSLATLLAGPNQIGSVTISNNVSVVPVGIATVGSSPNYIGLTTTYQARSATTLYAGWLSASGYSTLAVPPNGQRFFIHSVLINSKGNSDGFIGSSTNPMIPWSSLATHGGFPYQHETPGLMAPVVEQAMTVRQFSLVTLSYSISAHFE